MVPGERARPHHRRLHDAGYGRAGVRAPDARVSSPGRSADPDGYREPRAPYPLRRTRLRRERLPHQADRRSGIRGARTQHAQAARSLPRQQPAHRDARRRGAQGHRRHPRPRTRNHHPAFTCRRIPRPRDRSPHPAHVALLGTDRAPTRPWRGTRRSAADGCADARRRQARHPRHHPAQARPPHAGGVRGDEAPSADRPRHPQGFVVEHPAPGRDDRAHPPRKVRRQRLPAGLGRRSDPDRGPHRQRGRRVRCADFVAPLQAGVADVARDRAAARRARLAFRSALRRRPAPCLGRRPRGAKARYQDEDAPSAPAVPA